MIQVTPRRPVRTIAPAGPADADLLERCRHGESRAWDTIVDRYGRLVYSIPRRYGLSDADAEDVFQAVFAALFRRIEQIRDESRLSAWLITTAHRECWRVGRQTGRYATLGDVIEDVGSPRDEDADRWERQHMVREALDQLGGRCQQLLTALFYTQGPADYETIARNLGMKIGSIGPTRARCFEKLQAILSEMGYQP